MLGSLVQKASSWIASLATYRDVAVLALVLCFGLLACQRSSPPSLIEVTEVAPRELEVGDRVEVRGAGFPQGKAARVTFRGSVRRPGLRPATMDLDVEGSVTSNDRVEFTTTDAFVGAFSGREDTVEHATFRGDVEVAFPSRAPGAPPLVGQLRGVVLDVRSNVRRSALDEHLRDGARLLAFLGVTAGPVTPRGLPIESVGNGSLAERFGFQVGDTISEIDGVRVLSLADLSPASARSMDLTLIHDGLHEGTSAEVKTIPMLGFATGRLPVEYDGALVLVGLALFLLAFAFVPSPKRLRAFEVHVASRLRTTSLRVLVSRLTGPKHVTIALLLGSFMVGTLAFGPFVVDPTLDGILLLAAAVGCWAVSRTREARGFVAKLRATGSSLTIGGVLATCMFGMVLLQGALSPSEMSRAQGGWLWEMAAVQKPAASMFAFAYVGTLVALFRARRGDLVLSLTDVSRAPTPPSKARRNAEHLLDRLGLLFACALGVALFFGGWQLPGMTIPKTTSQHVAVTIFFVLKTWTLDGVVLGIATALSPWSFVEIRSFVVWRLLPSLTIGGALLVASQRLFPRPAVTTAWSAFLLLAILLAGLRFVLGVYGTMRRPRAHVSPFL